MANNVIIGTTGSVVATYERAGVQFPAQVPAGGLQGTNGGLTVTSSPQALVTASTNRRYVILQNQSAVNVYYGYSASIGAGLSNYIAPGDSLTSEVTAAIWLVVASGSATVTFDSVTN